MKFLVDANLPPGLASWLREHSHEAIHVNDQPGLALDDRAIFEFARRHGYIIMTKDEDFAALATLEKIRRRSPGCDSATQQTPCCVTG
jgi:predicted nuclease of predicted toxin-antitoxin system